MVENLSQRIALVTYGNNFLRNGKLPASFPEHRTFNFCNKVDFRIFERPFFFMKQKEKPIASNPVEWFEYLLNSGCKSLRVHFKSSADQSFAKDYKLAGLIGGGGSWFIEAVYMGFSNIWIDRWEVTEKDDPDRKIWAVKYAKVYSEVPTIDEQIPQEKTKTELNIILNEIEKFAFSHHLDYWGNQFSQAKAELISDTPGNSDYMKELIPTENYSLTARQLLFASCSAWVFGAMGSWNDLGFNTDEENKEYESLTESLFDKVNRAIISSVNSF